MRLQIGLYITQRLTTSQIQTVVWATWIPQWQTLTNTWNTY